MFITQGIKESALFKAVSHNLQDSYTRMMRLLCDYSVPFFSQRYAGHMTFETSLPGILGWTSTVLCNPNNVAFEASPITTRLEIDVGHDMCEMLGYNEKGSDGKPQYWGHIACDGTVANLESIWCVAFLNRIPTILFNVDVLPQSEYSGLVSGHTSHALNARSY